MDFTRFIQEISMASVGQSSHSRGRFFLTRLEGRVQDVTGAILGLSDYLASLPGRKNVLFFSGGYVLNASEIIADLLSGLQGPQSTPFSERSFFRLLQKAINQANQSQVSFYAIDARGLLTGADTSIAFENSLQSRLRRYAGINAPQEFLKSLAKETGGTAFLNSNDIGDGLERAYQDSGRYYLIGYVPSEKRKKNKYYPIRVEVARPGVKIRFRPGYFASPPAVTSDSQYFNAFRFPGLYEDSTLQVAAHPDDGKLIIQALIPTPSLDFRQQEGQRVCDVEVRAALVDEAGQWLRGEFVMVKDLRLQFTPLDLLHWLVRHKYTLVETETSVPAGSYNLIVVVRQSLTGRLSTHHQTLEIEPAAKQN